MLLVVLLLWVNARNLCIIGLIIFLFQSGFLELNALNNSFEFLINLLHVLELLNLYLRFKFLAFVHDLLSSMHLLIQVGYNLFRIFFEDVRWLFFLDEFVTAVVDDTFDADQGLACDTVMAHHLFRM